LAGHWPGVAPESYDLLIRNGVIYDGSGGASYVGDVGIKGDLIVYADPHPPRPPPKRSMQRPRRRAGFINMLSWATGSLLVDGLGQSDLRQGVTLEVMGEGWSMGRSIPK
jgi:N-acyl-D-amino-acid deacylase